MSEQGEKSFLEQFGARLKEIRTSKDLSYRKLAQKCNLDYSDIKKYELGQKNITLLTLCDLAKGLGVKPHVLLMFPMDDIAVISEKDES